MHTQELQTNTATTIDSVTEIDGNIKSYKDIITICLIYYTLFVQTLFDKIFLSI